MKEPETPDPSGGRPRLIQLLSDDHLARRAKKGDRRAFEAIYRRYHQDLYRFCLVMVGNPQDAQDALQNTMVKVLRALPGEQRHIRLKPWLYRIARNEAVETIRRRRDNVEIEAEHIPSTLEIAETAETRERLRRLIADLAALPERQRAALTMRELGGFGFEQIGAAFDTSPAAARQTIYEARLSLRQMEAGREMDCKKVTREVSEADGRITRRRDIQAHLRSCSECRAFRDAITKRRGELGALAPLPLAASAGMLEGILGAGGGGGAAGALTGTAAAGAGKVVATSAVAKSAATVAVVAVVSVGAADRGGVIDLPPTGGDDQVSKGVLKRPSAPASSAPSAASGVAGVDAKLTRRSELSRESESVTDSSRREAVNARPAHAGSPSRSRPSAAHPGRGKSKEARGSPSQGPPPAAGRGQSTAAERKAPPGNPSPGSGGKPSAKSTPPPRAAKPSKSDSAPVAPPSSESVPAEPSPGADPGGTAAKRENPNPVETPQP